MPIVDLLCRRPSLLGWPVHVAPSVQKRFPLLSGQIVDLALWHASNYWLVRILSENATDLSVEHSVFECVTFKAAFNAELQGLGNEAHVLPVLFVARDVQEQLLEWSFQLGVWVRCVDLEANYYG